MVKICYNRSEVTACRQGYEKSGWGLSKKGWTNYPVSLEEIETCESQKSIQLHNLPFISETWWSKYVSISLNGVFELQFWLGLTAIPRVVRACKIWFTGICGILKAVEGAQIISFSTSFYPPLLIQLALPFACLAVTNIMQTPTDNRDNVTIQESGLGTEEIKAEQPQVTFPEGGLRAWSVVAGAFCISFCTFGYLNAYG